MTKSLDAANLTETQSDSLTRVALARLDFSSGVVTAHTGIGDLVFNAETYTGVGDLGGIEAIQAAPDLRPQPLRLTLSGIDSGLVGTALTEDYHGREAKIYSGFLDSDGALVADPELDWSGRMDHMSIDLGPQTGSITVTCESRFADWDIPRVSRFTNEDQQIRYSGDTFFEYLDQMVDVQLSWGGKRIGGGGGLGNASGAGSGFSRLYSSATNNQGR